MAEDEKVKIQRGDIIHLEYDLWITDDNILFDTTHKELAEEHEITDENAKYDPIPLIVDEGKAITGLYNSLLKAEVGKDYEIEVPPEEGLGIRDPKLVEWHMMNDIRRQKLEPMVGNEITVKDKSGRERSGVVTMVSPRRVRVDYNNPLAGKTLKYNYKILDRADKSEDKVNVILEMDFGKKDDFEIVAKKDNVEIVLPDVCKYDQMWLIAKYKVVNDLREYAGFKTIRFIEEYVKKEKEEEKEEEKESNPEKQKEGEAKEAEPEKEEAGEEEKESEPEQEKGEDGSKEVEEAKASEEGESKEE